LAETLAAHAADTHHDDDGHGHTNTGISNEKLAMWLFLGSECLLLGGLISTFLLYRKKLNSFPGFENAEISKLGAQVFDIPFTSVSSFVLLMSSLTMVLAVSSLQRRDEQRMRIWLLATALLGASFIAGQIYEFTAFVKEGLGFTTNIFSSAFFTLTGFHGAHVAIGIVILMTMFAMSLQGRLGPERAEALEIAGLYWHFVDVVWVVVFVVVYLIK